MRETKFRGKRISDGKWFEGVPVPNSLGKRTYILGLITSDKISYSMNQLHEFCYEVIPETVGQSTGLKDKNGVDIYEGDICIAYQRYGKCTVKIIWEGNGFYTEDRSGYFYRIGEWALEIVGNIYDNPELLEVVK